MERSAVMLVRHILEEKGRDVIAISEAATVSEAALLLAERRIGAVLVTNGPQLSGIFSERDLVRAIAKDGSSALAKGVSHYMTKQVATCRETDTIEVLMEMMTMGRF